MIVGLSSITSCMIWRIMVRIITVVVARTVFGIVVEPTTRRRSMLSMVAINESTSSGLVLLKLGRYHQRRRQRLDHCRPHWQHPCQLLDPTLHRHLHHPQHRQCRLLLHHHRQTLQLHSHPRNQQRRNCMLVHHHRQQHQTLRFRSVRPR